MAVFPDDAFDGLLGDRGGDASGRIQHYVAQALHDGDADREGYAAGLRLLAAAGFPLGIVAADAMHNHLGFYSRKHPLDASSDRLYKRLNLQGGTVSEVDGEPLADTYGRVYAQHDNVWTQSAENGGIVEYRFVSEGKAHAGFRYSPTRESLSLVNVVDDARIFEADPFDREMHFPGTVTGAVTEGEGVDPDSLADGELAFDTDAERLYYRSTEGQTYAIPATGPLE